MEERKCKSNFGDYECHVKTNVKDSKGNFVYVDKCLKEAVENLNAVGFRTVASCCGHGIVNPKISIEALSDGMGVNLESSNFNLSVVSNCGCITRENANSKFLNIIDDIESKIRR